MPQDDQGLLSRLKTAGLDFVVIGGVCCVYHGVPIATYDLDICCRFDETNVRKIHTALHNLHPYHRLTPQKLPFELTPELFADLKNLYLETDLGRLDCLSEVLGVGDYEAVLHCSEAASFSYGNFSFLGLDALITAKEHAGRDRDIAALRHLKAIREKLIQQSKNPKPQ